MGEPVQIIEVNEPDPTTVGLLIIAGAVPPPDGAVGWTPGNDLRTPARIYLKLETLVVMLAVASELLAFIMELLAVDRLIIFDISESERAASDELSPPFSDDLATVIARLRTLGFRSPRISLDGVLVPTLGTDAISLNYVRAKRG